ncbi:fumarylacetoacetate hydrolase family protein [Bradyrhizobium prioriisuperbiae]|uniref:fumarylacetoacetate hydrolase family protein n=1 Tax=Bradyrhizobium prioriisuperbiae TaxID=2854389 RepID=UPI0028E54039|nr:fumarylacetoacetate hydrolase family protein [Bradyrhizobium prioritasuperba]
MKFASYSHQGSKHLGVVDVTGQSVRPIAGAIDMVDLIARYETLKPQLASDAPGHALAEVRLHAPIEVPRRNIICVGKNYGEHAKEFSRSGFEAGAVKGAEIDDYPAVFSKGPNTVVGPYDDVKLHSHITSSVDYEVELAVIIGKGGRDIAKADAYKHVFGYTVVNDVTARDRQKNHKQWFLGKTLDTFCPMGPWIVTSDELDPENLDVKCWVNDELRQNANTSDLIFDIPTLIATISAGMALVPGDIIATGTPAGVGIGFTPPKFLKAGDVVAMEISNIGRIENKFVA